MMLIAMCEKRKSVGCAIIQAMLGGTVPSHQLAMVPWDVSLDGMRLYEITDEQLDRLIELNR